MKIPNRKVFLLVKAKNVKTIRFNLFLKTYYLHKCKSSEKAYVSLAFFSSWKLPRKCRQTHNTNFSVIRRHLIRKIDEKIGKIFPNERNFSLSNSI